MKTRQLGGAIFIISLIASILSVIVYDYPAGVLFGFSVFVVAFYLAYVVDERIEPHITINDWMLGRFPQISELSENEAERRLNVLRHRHKEGSFKIRFVFNRRFNKEEIINSKEKLQAVMNNKQNT